jgi:hypothetical protein
MLEDHEHDAEIFLNKEKFKVKAATKPGIQIINWKEIIYEHR